MATKHAAAIATLIAIAIPATALAGFPGARFSDFEGKVERDPSTTFGFDVSRVNGHRAAHEFDLAGIPFACHDGSITRASALFDEGSLAIQQGSFSGELTDPDLPGYELTVAGELPSPDRARGTFALRSRGAAASERCYSGVLRWRAQKVG